MRAEPRSPCSCRCRGSEHRRAEPAGIGGSAPSSPADPGSRRTRARTTRADGRRRDRVWGRRAARSVRRPARSRLHRAPHRLLLDASASPLRASPRGAAPATSGRAACGGQTRVPAPPGDSVAGTSCLRLLRLREGAHVAAELRARHPLDLLHGKIVDQGQGVIGPTLDGYLIICESSKYSTTSAVNRIRPQRPALCRYDVNQGGRVEDVPVIMMDVRERADEAISMKNCSPARPSTKVMIIPKSITSLLFCD